MNKLLQLLIVFTLFFIPYLANGQGTVPLKIEKFGSGILPENSKVIVLTQKGTKRKLTSDNKVPSLSNFHVYKHDILDHKSQTSAQYPKTQLTNGNIYFVYVLTPDNNIYFSSDKNGLAEFKQVVTGLIYVKLLSISQDKWNEIYSAFNYKTHFEISHRDSKTLLPADAKLAILTQQKNIQQSFKFPTSDIFTSDYIVDKGKTFNEYQKSAVTNLRYFVYAYSNEKLYFTSNSTGQPFYDVIVSGKMYLSEVNEQYDKNELLRIYFKDTENALNVPSSSSLVEHINNSVETAQNEDFDAVANDEITAIENSSNLTENFDSINVAPQNEAVAVEIDHELNESGNSLTIENSNNVANFSDNIKDASSQKDFDLVTNNEQLERPQSTNYFHWIIIALLTIAAFFISRKYIKPKQFVDFIFIGFVSTLFISAYSSSYPLIFSTVGFFLGVYFALTKEEEAADKVFVVYTYTIAGFAYSFFFQAIIVDMVLTGRTLDFLSLSIGIPFIAIAASILVHIFCVSLLVLGKDNFLTKILTYGSVIFIPFVFIEGIKILYVQVALVHYIFIIALIALIVNFSNNSKYTSSFGCLGMILAFISTLLNYLIVPAIFAGIFNYLFENKFKKTERLNNNQRKTSRILALGTLIFHLLYFLIFEFLGSLIMKLTNNMVLSFSLSISLIGIIPIASLALSIFKNENNHS